MNKVFNYQFQVLESHLDTFGHVNNATYLELYEEARWDFITKNGYGLDVIKSTGVGPIILEVNLKFRKELLNRETVTVRSQTLDFLNPLIMELRQEMIKENGELASELILKVGVFDLQRRKLTKPNDQWLHAIGVNKDS